MGLIWWPTLMELWSLLMNQLLLLLVLTTLFPKELPMLLLHLLPRLVMLLPLWLLLPVLTTLFPRVLPMLLQPLLLRLVMLLPLWLLLPLPTPMVLAMAMLVP